MTQPISFHWIVCGPQRLYRFPAVKNLGFWEFSTEALGSTAGAVLGSFLGRRCMFLCFFVFFFGEGKEMGVSW